MRRRRATSSTHQPGPQGSPFLREVELIADRAATDQHPFNVRAFRNGLHLRFDARVTFFVGENGSGKSTLLEAIATSCGFPIAGGSRDHRFQPEDTRTELGKALRLSWLPKVTDGFFLRAESFFNFATYLDEVSTLRAYGGKSLHAQSHGESFMALFVNRFEQGIYLLDEANGAHQKGNHLRSRKGIHSSTQWPGSYNTASFLPSRPSPRGGAPRVGQFMRLNGCQRGSGRAPGWVHLSEQTRVTPGERHSSRQDQLRCGGTSPQD